jgi:hypothetical protein
LSQKNSSRAMVASTKAAEEIHHRPDQTRSRPHRHASLNLLEVPKEPAVSKIGEAGEVVLPHVHRLHEGCVRDHEPAFAQDASHFRHHLFGVEDMLEHRKQEHAINCIVADRQFHSVADDIDVWTEYHVTHDDSVEVGLHLVGEAGVIAGTDDEAGPHALL